MDSTITTRLSDEFKMANKPNIAVALDATEEQWKDWRWQQKNSLRSANQIQRYFPNFPESEIEQIAQYEQTRRWGITPYTLSLMKTDEQGNPDSKDPFVKQFFPIRGFCLDNAIDSYSGGINWETPSEMPTRLLHHKYPHKVIIRTIDSCLGYCGSCFEVGRVEDKEKHHQKRDDEWQKSIEYISQHSEIKEVIISGGDPLLLDDKALSTKLLQIDFIQNIRVKRIHTRALTFNPYRFDEGLCKRLNYSWGIQALGIHVVHPSEINKDFTDAICRINQYGWPGIKFSMTPLLRGINDNKDTLEELFMRLYENGIKPYYLIHCFPGIQGASQFRTSVRKGVELMNSLKRKISNIAMPEYIIPHNDGKHTIPLEPNGTPEFQYTQDEQGNPIIRFKNWKGNWGTYLDSPEQR